jgi:hypothetical protein
MEYVPSAALASAVPALEVPPTGKALTQIPVMPAPPTEALTVPEMLVPDDIVALTPVAGFAVVTATKVPGADSVPDPVPLYHWVAKSPPPHPGTNVTP